MEWWNWPKDLQREALELFKMELSDEVLETADYIVEPIEGVGEFNHLSVRSAVAILLDRITEI